MKNLIDQEKVVLMSRLAILDQNHIKKDLKIIQYYPEDYVYINNIKTRISIFILVMIGSCMHLLWKVEQGMNIPQTWEELVIGYVIPYGSVLVIALCIYTLLSTRVYKKRYNEALKHVNEYKEILAIIDQKELEKIEGEKHYANKRRVTKAKTADSTIL